MIKVDWDSDEETQLLEKIVGKLIGVPYDCWKSELDKTKEDPLSTYSVDIENIEVKVSSEMTNKIEHRSYNMQVYDDSVNSTTNYTGKKVKKLYDHLTAKKLETESNRTQQAKVKPLQRLLGYLEDDKYKKKKGR